MGFLRDTYLETRTIQNWLTNRFENSYRDLVSDVRIWEELQRQLDMKGLKVKKGVVQDASFITADPGHAPVDKPRGGEARTRRSRDGA